MSAKGRKKVVRFCAITSPERTRCFRPGADEPRPAMVGWRTSPPLCSHLGCLRQSQGVFDFDTKVADSGLDLGMT